MAYGVIVPEKIMATDIGSLNATFVSGSNIENGMLLYQNHQSGSSGYTEVFYGVMPMTGSMTDLWMAYTPEIVNVTAADGTAYRGLNQDPRNFIVAAGSLVDCFHPQVNDIVLRAMMLSLMRNLPTLMLMPITISGSCFGTAFLQVVLWLGNI